MTLRWAPQTNYTLRRKTANIIKRKGKGIRIEAYEYIYHNSISIVVVVQHNNQPAMHFLKYKRLKKKEISHEQL